MDLHSAPDYNFNRDTYRMQIAIGSTLYPANPIRSCAEHTLSWSRLWVASKKPSG